MKTNAKLKEKIIKLISKLETLEHQIGIKIAKKFFEFEDRYSNELKAIKEFNEEIAKDTYSKYLKLDEEIKLLKEQVKSITEKQIVLINLIKESKES